MPYNLLFLPLLGGYLFLRWWNRTRYHALRAEKERLLLMAAVPGLASLIVAFAIVEGSEFLFPCSNWPHMPCVSSWWQANVPFDYLGTSLLAFSLGATLCHPWNLICKREIAINKVIENDRVPFEILLKKAQDQAKTIAVTMANGKIYIGFVTHLFNPGLPTRFIQILPTKSGYRDEKTKTFEFTTPYLEALDGLDRDFEEKANKLQAAEAQYEEAKQAKAAAEKLRVLEAEMQRLDRELEEIAAVADDFGIVLPVSDIVSLNIFSEYIHAKYFAHKLDSPIELA